MSTTVSGINSVAFKSAINNKKQSEPVFSSLASSMCANNQYLDWYNEQEESDKQQQQRLQQYIYQPPIPSTFKNIYLKSKLENQ
jgi:hypothetical protein